MQYLTLYTPSAAPGGMPSPEHMAKMGALIEEMMAAGVLLQTGPLGRRETGGMRVTLQDGRFEAVDNPPGESVLLSASGFALLQAGSKEELLEGLRRFLETAGDGSVEIIQLADMPPPGAGGA